MCGCLLAILILVRALFPAIKMNHMGIIRFSPKSKAFNLQFQKKKTKSLKMSAVLHTNVTIFQEAITE